MRAVSLLAALGLAAGLSSGGGPSGPPAAWADRTESIQVFWGGGRAPERVEASREGGEIYVPAGVVARWLGAVNVWDPGTLMLTLRGGGHETRFSVGSPWVGVDGALVNLPMPVRLRRGVVEVPLSFVREVGPEQLGLEVCWDPDRSALTFLRSGVNVLRLEMEGRPGGLLEVHVALAESLGFVLDSTRPGELRLRLAGGVLEEGAEKQWRPLLPVRRIRTSAEGPYAEIIFEMASSNGMATAVPAAGGRGITLRLQGFLPEAGAEPPFQGTRAVPPGAARLKKKGVRPLIVVDPGHGGTERGAEGVTGFLEKKANLEIALFLKSALEADGGFRVLLTREDDRLVPLDRRAEMPNLFGAEAFVSIHCNAWVGPGPRGFEVYVAPGPVGTQGLPEVVPEGPRAGEGAGEGERGGPFAGGKDREQGLDVLLWERAQQGETERSRALAAMVREEMRLVGLRDRGTKQARLGVLSGVLAPAVLVETAFISHPEEERLLQNVNFRREVARALASAIRRFYFGDEGTREQ